MHVEVLLRTNVFQWPLSETLTFDLETWFMHITLLLIGVNICMKIHKNPSICVGDMFWTKPLYLIIFSDLDIAYIKLNNMFHTRSYANDHLCFIPLLSDD
jgi:hypothetical protein